MKQTVTIEIEDHTALRLLRDLAAMNVIRFTQELDSEENLTARLNEIYEKEDSSLEPCLMMAQAEILNKEDW